jgi:protein-S-isoprenylcysteine O-methyltransferase Ste14
MSETYRRLRLTLVSCVTIAAPFLFAPERLLHPSSVALLLGVVVIYMTQPTPSNAQLTKSPSDKKSAVYILLAGNICALTPVLEFVLRSELRPSPTSLWTLIGIALLSAGVALRVWSITVLGRHFTAVVQTADTQELIEQGPYARIRHPSYSGVLLTLLGECIAFQSVFGAVASALLMVPAYWYRISVEEQALLARFEGRYVEYQKRTGAVLPLRLWQ